MKRRTGDSAWPTRPGAEDAGGVSLLEFVNEQLDLFDDDLPHAVPRLGPVSYEPYAEPGCGPSVIREPHVLTACRGQLPLPGAGTAPPPILGCKFCITVPSARRSR